MPATGRPTVTGSLGPTSTSTNDVCNSFTAHVAFQVHRLPSMTRSLTPLTAQCRAHGTRREHRMPSKPLAALCYARHSPGLTPLAARSAAHARACLPGSLLPGGGPARASTGAGSRSHERPPRLARAARSIALALVAYFQLRALRRRPLPASSPAPPDITARFQSGAARRCPPPPTPPTPPHFPLIP